MASGLGVGGDIEQALENVGVPSYVLDDTGVVRWINAAAERLVGDVRGRHFTSVVAPEDKRRARELFSQKVLGTSPATEATGILISTAGTRVAVELSAVPLMNGERVVGVFGLIEESSTTGPAPPPHLTPRQVEVLRLLEQGLLDEADRRRAPCEYRDGQEPCPPSLSGPRRQLPTGSRRRRTGRVTVGAVTPNSETETRSSVLSERRERLSGRFYFNQFVEVVGNSAPEVLDVEPSRSHGCQVMLHVQVEVVR